MRVRRHVGVKLSPSTFPRIRAGRRRSTTPSGVLPSRESIGVAVVVAAAVAAHAAVIFVVRPAIALAEGRLERAGLNDNRLGPLQIPARDLRVPRAAIRTGANSPRIDASTRG